MRNHAIIYKCLTYFIATVWLVNGLYCKVLNMVPRHQLIVSAILGETYAVVFTKAIGIAEILMVVWLLSRIRPRLCAITQIVVIAVMNCLEFFMVPQLLLFGKFNAMVALFFISVIYFNEFWLAKKIPKRA